MARALLLILVTLCSAQTGSAQLLIDTLFTWQGYGRQSVCRVQVFESAPGERRERTIVIDELAQNTGPSILDDVQHLAELIGRNLAQEPEAAYWIFHFGGFSFPGAGGVDKEVFLRATFRRSARGGLGSPHWRLIDRETIVKVTDRAYR